MTIRPLRQIFEHLRKLCHQPGFLHAISWILYRDFYVSMDDQGKITLAGQQDRYARSRLNNNEFMLLAGLLAQSDTPDVFLESGETDLLVATADRLLEELHTRMEAPMREALQNPDALRLSQYNFGNVAREAIYYGAESAFTFQYRNFARDRYRPDYEWLLKHKGISVRPMIDIAQSIVYFTSLQVNVSLDHTAIRTPILIRFNSALLLLSTSKSLNALSELAESAFYNVFLHRSIMQIPRFLIQPLTTNSILDQFSILVRKYTSLAAINFRVDLRESILLDVRGLKLQGHSRR